MPSYPGPNESSIIKYAFTANFPCLPFLSPWLHHYVLCSFLFCFLLSFYFASNPGKAPYVAFSMQVPVDHTDPGIGTVPQSARTPNWIINVSDVRKQNFRVAINSGVLFIIWILVVKNVLLFSDWNEKYLLLEIFSNINQYILLVLAVAAIVIIIVTYEFVKSEN